MFATRLFRVRVSIRGRMKSKNSYMRDLKTLNKIEQYANTYRKCVPDHLSIHEVIVDTAVDKPFDRF